jgi:hypothetical protein
MAVVAKEGKQASPARKPLFFSFSVIGPISAPAGFADYDVDLTFDFTPWTFKKDNTASRLDVPNPDRY